VLRRFFVIVAMLVIALGCNIDDTPFGIGDPCVPDYEYDTTFLGFELSEVHVDRSPQLAGFECGANICIVNHFRGRITCPYGQDKAGLSLPGTDGASSGAFPATDTSGNPVGPCLTPRALPVTGNPSNDPTDDAEVRPQCLDRAGTKAVYCSCRCANPDGRTDDGARYCSCPDGFTCSQLLSPDDKPNSAPGMAGAYCIKNNTEYNAATSLGVPCDPTIPAQSCAPSPIR
jgi:hypothetical protein